MMHDSDNTENRDRRKPDTHNRTERLADHACSPALDREQADQDGDGDRHGVRLEYFRCDVEAFDRAQDRDGGRDDAIPVDEGRTEQAHQ